MKVNNNYKLESMKSNIFYGAVAGVILLTSATLIAPPAQEYKIKEGFKIEFKSKDPSGVFKEAKGTVKFDENDLANSKFALTFPVSSISTGNGMMNKKAQIEEWFNSEKYPDIKYVSSKIDKSGEDFIVYGTLTIKGISKEKKVPLKVANIDGGMKFTGSFVVNRMDFKVGHESDAVPNNMNISFSLPVTKK
jgi:polyisoprenoid-binding protein YceI